MVPAGSLTVVMRTRDMVAMVTFVFCIIVSSAHGLNPFCSDSFGCVLLAPSDSDGSVLKRNVFVWLRLSSTSKFLSIRN